MNIRIIGYLCLLVVVVVNACDQMEADYQFESSAFQAANRVKNTYLAGSASEMPLQLFQLDFFMVLENGYELIVQTMFEYGYYNASAHAYLYRMFLPVTTASGVNVQIQLAISHPLYAHENCSFTVPMSYKNSISKRTPPLFMMLSQPAVYTQYASEYENKLYGSPTNDTLSILVPNKAAIRIFPVPPNAMPATLVRISAINWNPLIYAANEAFITGNVTLMEDSVALAYGVHRQVLTFVYNKQNK
jgi:hypothetical protein